MLDDTLRAYQVARDREALLRVLESCQGPVYNACFHVLRNAQDAEDAAQDVLVELVDALPSMADGGHLRRWLNRAALFRAVDVRRKNARRAAHEREKVAMKERVSPDDADLIHEHLALLDEDERHVLMEHFFGRRTLDAIAEEEGCSSVAVWKRVQKAMERLRGSLAQAGLAGVVPLIDVHFASLQPVAPPAGLISKAVLAKVAGAGSAAAFAAGGIALKSKVMTTIAAAIVVAGAVGIASRLRAEAGNPRAREMGAVREAEGVAQRSRVADLESECDSVDSQIRSLKRRAERAAFAAPAAAPRAETPLAGIDWRKIYASVDWKRLVEILLMDLDAQKAANLERVMLDGRARDACHAVVRIAPIAFDDESMVQAICLLRAWATGNGSASVLGELERTQEAIDRLIREHDEMCFANVLTVLRLRQDLTAHLAGAGLPQPIMGWVNGAGRWQSTQLQVEDRESVVKHLAGYWAQRLELPQEAAPSVAEVARPYVDAWFAVPQNAWAFERGYVVVESLADAVADVEAHVRAQRELLRRFTLSDPARNRLLTNRSSFSFTRPREDE